MVYITLANGDAYSEEVLSQKQKTYDNVSVPYKRGDIKDRNGSVLATSVKVYNLVLEPKNVLADENIKYKQKTVDALVKYFGVTEEEVNKALKDSESWYKVLKKQIPGAFFSALIWSVTSWGFSVYIDAFHGFSTYGSLTTVIAVLIYMYAMLYIALIGAYINRYFGPIYRLLFGRLFRRPKRMPKDNVKAKC